MNRRSDIMRAVAIWVTVALLVAAAVFVACGDVPCACVCLEYACVFLLWAIIIKLEWL